MNICATGIAVQTRRNPLTQITWRNRQCTAKITYIPKFWTKFNFWSHGNFRDFDFRIVNLQVLINRTKLKT